MSHSTGEGRCAIMSVRHISKQRRVTTDVPTIRENYVHYHDAVKKIEQEQ